MGRPESYLYTLLLLSGLAAGAALPLQAGINAQLSRRLGSPIQAALVSFVVGTLLLVVLCVIGRIAWPSISQLRGAPAWLFLGGVFGAFFVPATVMLAPRLGATVMISAIIAGQMVTSLIVDHYGILGFEPRPVDLLRVIGALMLIAGVVIVLWK